MKISQIQASQNNFSFLYLFCISTYSNTPRTMLLKNMRKLKIKWEINSSLTITNMLLQKRCFRTSIIRDDLMFYFCTTFPIFLLFAGGPKSRQTKLGAFEWRTSRFNHCWRFRKQSQTQTPKGSWWSQETAHCSKYFSHQLFPSLFYDFFFLFPILPFQSEGEDELKKRQLMELAIINGTYRDSQSKNSSRKLKDKGVRSFLFTIKSVRSFLFTFHLQPALKPKGSW